MLRALRGADINEQRGMLANAALAMHGGTTAGDFELPQDERLQALVNEAAYELGIDLASPSIKDRMRLASLFSGQLTKLVLDNKSRIAARKRLGREGLLELDDYVIRMSDLVKNQARQFGFQIEQVRKCLRDPTSYQHTFEGDEELGDINPFSLFVKHYGEAGDPNLHWMLVVAERKGNELHAYAAWLIFNSELQDKLDLSYASPEDLLIAFVNAFGLEVSIGGAPAKVYTSYQRILLRGPIKNVKLAEVKADKDTQFSMNLLVMKKTEPPSFDVALAFCIDDSKYAESLRRHGMNVREKRAA